METSDYLSTVKMIHEDGKKRGLFFQTPSDATIHGKQLELKGKKVTSFSSCSYLGLESHPLLIEGVKQAVDRYGTQFSSSRGYISVPLYDELEELLSLLFGGYALVTSSTSLGHQSALGVLVTEKDGIVLDHQVHFSVQLAAQLCRSGGAKVKWVPHNQLENAFAVVEELSKTCDKVWFACDGVFSMYGDLAPIGFLNTLLQTFPKVHLYVDDAHGMSWAGLHGRGSFLSRMPLHERLVVGTSLNKAFASSGGCLIFPTQQQKDWVRMCGGPQLFSGPVQPPMLGASIASAKLHLSDEIKQHQKALQERVLFCNQEMKRLNLPLLVENEAPICFIRMGAPTISSTVAQKCLEEGYFINVSMYPGVPMKKTGIRLAITAQHSFQEIREVLELISFHSQELMQKEGFSRADLDQLFAKTIPDENDVPTQITKPVLPKKEKSTENFKTKKMHPISDVVEPISTSDFVLKTFQSIAEIDPEMWNQFVGVVGACNWDSMKMWEEVFGSHQEKEHCWKFHYVVVQDASQKTVGMTFFTEVLLKDDMLMTSLVSQEVEKRREEKKNPYFLTSSSLMMGSMCSEGNHLYLDRSSSWRSVLFLILEFAFSLYEEKKMMAIHLRDLPSDDIEMDTFLLEQGLMKVPMKPSHYLVLQQKDFDSFEKELPLQKRRYIRKYMKRHESLFRFSVHGAKDAEKKVFSKEEIDHLHQLYLNVAKKNLSLNVFHLPKDILPAILENPSWEILLCYPKTSTNTKEKELPIGFYVAQKERSHYTPFFCGLDYQWVQQHGLYRQILYQCAQRASFLGMKSIHMGMDADFVKSRLGSQTVENCIYSEVREHFQGLLLRDIVSDVSLRKGP